MASTVSVMPEAMGDAEIMMSRARSAIGRAEHIMKRSRTLLEATNRFRGEGRDWPRFFVLHGRLDAQPVKACWFCGSLLATPVLRARAELLVALGESFNADSESPTVEADLDRPLAAMLTLIRACDQVKDARFGPLGYDPPVQPVAT